MISATNPYDMSDLSALKSRAGAKIAGAIQNASARTGTDFSYLLQQANVESSFRPTVKARTSSATGLFQFIESTWIGMVRDHGAKYGLSDLAARIDENGRVSDRKTRQQILNLRKDPHLASLMAGEYASDNKEHLEKKVGGDIGSTELYMAHFMGPGGAAKFLNELKENPNASAARVFPREARANPNVFFNDGKPRTLNQVYAFFDRKFAIDTDQAPQQIQTAQADIPNKITAPARTHAGRVDVFDETKGTWFKSSDPTDIYKDQLLTALLPERSGNNSFGFQGFLHTPVDILTLLEAQNTRRDERYNV